MPPQLRQLSEDEYNTVLQAVTRAAPDNLDEAGFQRYMSWAMPQALTQAEAQPAGSAFSRFASNLGEMVNPVTIAKGLYGAVTDIPGTARALVGQQVAQGQQAADLFGQGRYSEALGHGVASVVPLVGPMAAEAGEQIGAGDIAGGLGKGVGLLAPITAAPVARAAVTTARTVAPAAAARVASALEDAAASRYVNVMRPELGAGKQRFGAMAAKVAPALAGDSRFAAWSRGGLQSAVEAAYEDASAALDAAHDARLKARTFKTQPILDDLAAAREQLVPKGVEASQYPPPMREVEGGGRVPIDTPVAQPVVPSGVAERVGQLDDAVRQIKALGPDARYDDLRKIRMAFDNIAKTKYSPIAPDVFANTQRASGAADVTGALRDRLAQWDPQTAAANADYSLAKSARDVLKATDEIERSRPKVGRKLMARFLGSVAGAEAAGFPGAIAGHLLAPALDAVIEQGPTMKLQTAQKLSALAKALRAGSEGGATSAWFNLTKGLSLKKALLFLDEPAAIAAGRQPQPQE
jgi:hypothetical protein